MVFWPICDPKIGFLRFFPGKLRVITSKPLLIDSTVKNTSKKVYLESLAYRAENARKSFYYTLPVAVSPSDETTLVGLQPTKTRDGQYLEQIVYEYHPLKRP